MHHWKSTTINLRQRGRSWAEYAGAYVGRTRPTNTWLLPCSLLAGPTIVQIDATQPGTPTPQVFRSQEYNLYLGPEVSDSTIEYGALVDLLGVDNVYNGGGQIADREWRFTDPRAPDQTHSAVYIVWIDHDYGDSVNGYYGPLFSGDLRVGFNEHKPGGYYTTVNAAPIKSDKWLTLYSDANLVLQFKGSLAATLGPLLIVEKPSG